MKYITPPSSAIPAPYINIEISDILNKRRSEVLALIDTGYDGEILIPFDLYTDLNLRSFEIKTNKSITAETITGEIIDLRSSLGNIKIVDDDLSITTTIDTYKQFDEIIVGRSFIENFNLILDGCGKKLEINYCDSSI